MHDVLLKSFSERRSPMDVYEELKKRSRKAGESSEEFVLAMEEIADDFSHRWSLRQFQIRLYAGRFYNNATTPQPVASI
jgi:hypothetical protein